MLHPAPISDYWNGLAFPRSSQSLQVRLFNVFTVDRENASRTPVLTRNVWMALSKPFHFYHSLRNVVKSDCLVPSPDGAPVDVGGDELQ